MIRLLGYFLSAALVTVLGNVIGVGQTTIPGLSLTFKSSGFNSGSDWVLSENGYVGTYITLDSAGSVTVTAEASGIAGGGAVPQMNIVIADTQAIFDVSSGFTDYQHTFDLPAGTYFVRTEFNNDVPTANRQLTVRDLSFSGGTVINTSNQTTNNSNALAAADTYIDRFRRGSAELTLLGATPGSPVHIQLKEHDFLFGTAVGGVNLGAGADWLVPTGNVNSDAYKLQQAIKANFNAIVPGNAGKWQQNEFNRDSIFIPVLQNMFDFAQAHDLRMRMHNMLWDNQQPSWVNTMLTNAQSPNPSTAAAAKAELRQEITERIGYYIGDGVGTDWSDMYEEVDILNEFAHEPEYMTIFSADGSADIYSEAAAAVALAGNDVKLFANEYNVLQWGEDPYGNWYRQHVEDLENAGGQVDGVGIQYYVDERTSEIGSNQHNAWRIMQTLQLLSVTGRDLALTEFGVNDGASEELASRFLEETVRLVFGSANSTGFTMFGFWEGDIYRPGAAFYTDDWQERLPLYTWQALMDEWSTDEMLRVAPDGTVDFTGFFGEYEITVDGKIFDLNFTKGINAYSLLVAVPGDFDDDLDVDGTDLAIWEGAYGVNASGDADNDGDTDGSDFLLWQKNFDPNGPLGATVAVPEPSHVMSMVAFASILLCRFAGSRNDSSE